MEIGRVIKVYGKYCWIEAQDKKIYKSLLRGKFRLMESEVTSPVVIGDIVDFEVKQGIATICQIHPRKNYIIRDDPFLKKSIITAANIDIFLPIYTLKEPYTPLIMLDKMLITAEAYSIPQIIIVNKIDILSSEEQKKLEEIEKIYKLAEYQMIKISALQKLNLDELRNAIEGKIAILMGASGVGKSTLINALCPSANVRTGPISPKYKWGQHTTTFSAIYKVNENTYIGDTAGLRIFKLSDIQKWELGHYFPEMRKVMNDCKFNNCTHTHEENCAVKKALELGHIHPKRYENYLKILTTETT